MKEFRMMMFFEKILKYHKALLTFTVLLAVFFSLFAPFVDTVDNVDYFALDDDPNTEIYDNVKKVFGNDEFFIIAFEKNELFTHENLTLLKKITEKIEEIDIVREVKSLANVDDTIGGDEYFEVRSFLGEIPLDSTALERLKKRAIGNPLYLNNLISADGNTAAIVVFIYDKPDDENYRRIVLERCNEIIDQFADEETTFWVAGWTTTNYYLSKYLKEDMTIFIPLTYLLITVSIFVFFGKLSITLLSLANISLCMGSTMGLFYLAGIAMNNVTSIVPPLIMALALCDTVHIFSHMDIRLLQRYQDKKKALCHVLQSIFVPCVLTTLTTAIGFLSLATSSIEPIRQFALMASAGMVFEFIFSFFFMVPLLVMLPSEKVFFKMSDSKWVTIMLEKMVHFNLKFNRIIFWISGGIVLFSVICAFQIRVETNLLEFFKASSPVRHSLAQIEKRLSGVGTVDVSFRSNDEDAFKDPTNLKIMEEVQNYVKQLPMVDVTLSFVDFIKDINQSFHSEDELYYRIPDSQKLISQYMLLYDSDDVDDFINSDYTHARISARTHEYSSANQKIMVDAIRKYIAEMPSHGNLEILVTGRAVYEVNTITALVEGQVYSLTIAVIVIFAFIFIVLRSVSIGFLSIIPNLFPIILNFGIMGLFSISLNTATSLISAVAIGIAVDDTIHFLFEYKRQKTKNGRVSDSIEKIIMGKGRAILTSSIILTYGFGVMVFSRFVPIVYFGVLSAIVMMLAVIGDLVVLPAVMHYLFNEKRKSNIQSGELANGKNHAL